MMTGGKILLILGALSVVIMPQVMPLAEWAKTGSGGRSEDAVAREQRNSSAIAMILGEFRTSVSDLLFVKTETYLHSGVQYKPHLDMAAMASTGDVRDGGTTPTVQNHDHDHDHHGHNHGPDEECETTQTDEIAAAAKRSEANVATGLMQETAHLKPGESFVAEEVEHIPTTVRTAKDDFRGFIGDLERHVHPWRDPSQPHQHSAGTELLPWYRMATISNRNNVRAYMIGAWWLKNMKTDAQREEGLRFLEEGIRNNPDAFQLYVMRGNLLRSMERKDEAFASYAKALDLAAKARPADGKSDGVKWTDYMEDDAVMAMTMTMVNTRNTKGTSAALELGATLVPQFPNMPPLTGIMDRFRNAPTSPDATTTTATATQ